MSVDNQAQVKETNAKSNFVFNNKWLHGVRYITYDHKGDIYWKGRPVDIISDPTNDKHYDYVRELGRNCEYLESLRIPVNIKTAVFHIAWFKEIDVNEPYKKLLIRCPDIRVASDQILLIFDRAASEFNGQEWQHFRLPDRLSNTWKKFWDESALAERGFQDVSLRSLNLEGVINCLKIYKVPTNLLDIMAESLSNKCRV